MSGTSTRESQAVRYWLTPASCVAAGGHGTVIGGRCLACDTEVQP